MKLQNLFELAQKENKIVVGIMSGTSVDALDVAAVEISGNGESTKLKLIKYLEYQYPVGLKELVLKNSLKQTSNVEEICRLNFLLPQIYYEAIVNVCNEINLSLNQVDLIGSHGQTIHHLPEEINIFNMMVRSTLQIADPMVLAKLTGIVTIGDFRVGDVALGGQGAPLVPYVDYILFNSKETSRALLNLGGIANFTILPKNCLKEEAIAFDTGPANMLIDMICKKYFNVGFDKNGEIAESGKINEELFEKLLSIDTYIKRQPPKSTGREYYNELFLNKLLQGENIPAADLLNTLTEYTAYSVYYNYEKFIKPVNEIDELILSGGGANNLYLVKCFKKWFGEKIIIRRIDELGMSSDAKEAICFAVLANETISGNPSNMIKVTGASRETILGKICLP